MLISLVVARTPKFAYVPARLQTPARPHPLTSVEPNKFYAWRDMIMAKIDFHFLKFCMALPPRIPLPVMCLIPSYMESSTWVWVTYSNIIFTQRCTSLPTVGQRGCNQINSPRLMKFACSRSEVLYKRISTTTRAW